MRLGKYSGKLYTEDEVKNMQECGVCVSDEQANNKEWINKQHLHDLKDCVTCYGCPMAQQNMQKESIKYNDEIMRAVRQNMGLDENDTSSDEKIMEMDKRDIFKKYCIWHGLMGNWFDILLNVVENIYDIKLNERR